MKLRHLIGPLVATMLLAASCSSLSVAAAIVNGTKITESQVETELDRVRKDPTFQDLLRQQADQVRGLARRQILNDMIRQQVIAQQAVRNGVKVTRAQTDQLISQEAQRQGMTVAEFGKAQNLGPADLQLLAGRIVREFELKRRVITYPAVSDASVQAFYKQNHVLFEEAHLARITVRTEADTSRVLQQLGATDFATVAKNLSIDDAKLDGGDLGYVPLTQLSTTVQAAVTQAQVGHVTDPIPTGAGFELYRVIDLRTQSIDSVRGAIRTQLGDQQLQTLFDVWLTSRVRQAHVVVNPIYGRFDRTTGQVVPGSGTIPD